MSSVQPFISPVLSLLGSLVSLAVMWGVLKTTVENMKTEVGRLREATDKHEELFASFREEVRIFMGIQKYAEAGKMSAGGRPTKRKRSR